MARLHQGCIENLLVSITICFILGASTAYLLAASLTGLPLTALILPLLLGLALVAYFLHPNLRPLSVLPFFFFIGLLHTHYALQPPSDPNHMARLITEKTKVTVIGRILTMVEHDVEKSRFELATESILIHGSASMPSFQPVRGKIQLSVPGNLDPHFMPGMTIMAIATLDRIRNYQTPGAFDYRLLMAAKSINCAGWVRSTGEILEVHELPFSLGQRLRYFPEQIRQRVALFLSQQFEPDIAGLYQALLVGSMVNVSPLLVEAFKENGCMHVLSISFLFAK